MYRVEDIEKIHSSISDIKVKASEIYKKTFPPTYKENSDVCKVIKQYIIDNNCIVYGGLAQHLAIKNKNIEDEIYQELGDAYYNWPELADIEFYSYEPIKDSINLTETLYKHKFDNISATQGVHPDTYKIFVNFLNYCDITYIPANIFSRMPVIIVNGIRIVHPHFMLVDGYRVLTDPLTSYWRLDKTIYRFQKILKYYPLECISISFPKHNNNNKLLSFIKHKIIKSSKLVVVGNHSYNYYISKCENYTLINELYYEVISDNLEEDVKSFYTILSTKYGKKINTKEYYPFFQFIDRRVEFYYKNILILIVYGNNMRCTVYKYSKKRDIHFGTFNLTILYLLFWYYYYYIVINNKILAEINMKMICILLNARNKYLTDNKLTVIDKSPFEDFTYECYGKTVDPIRLSKLLFLIKKKSKKLIKFNYNPSGKNVKYPSHKFNNCSGNKIINEKYIILKNYI